MHEPADVLHPDEPSDAEHEIRELCVRELLLHLDHELHLTPQQKEAVRQIVQQRHARIEAIVATTRPQMRQEIESMNAEIDKVLTPEQRQKFESLSQRMHQRHRGMRGGPPPPDASPH